MNHATNHDESPVHVVLGAGQIGTRIAKLLTAGGHRVRLVQRSRATNQLPLVDHVSGDIKDIDFSETVTRAQPWSTTA
jgi:nucleoside-diphosphate-sugar epimerase